MAKGFIDSLTPEQRKRALEYIGPDSLGSIAEAVDRVAEWPEWKRRAFEAFSKRNSE